MNHSIGFIGGGNMARSIVAGLVSSGLPGSQFHVSDPSEEQRARFREIDGVNTYSDNSECLEQSDVLILSVKPQVMKIVLESVSQPLQQRVKNGNAPLVVSIAAGIMIRDMLRWAGTDLPVIRVMPNTPALVNCGVSGLFANDLADQAQKEAAQSIMQAVGPVIWVPAERDIDTVTGISGSGPAYYFKLMEIMLDAAIEHGLEPDTARTLVLQTALGAATLANASTEHPAELRRQVTSPNGTTEAAILSMEADGIDDTVKQGIQAAIDRSEELANQSGEG